MRNESNMTIERGLGENILLRSAKLLERATGEKTYISLYHTKRDNSWNAIIKITNSDEPGKEVRRPVCKIGKSWDIVGAVESFRENLLEELSEQAGESFTNLAEYENFLDKRDNVVRNDVGAVDGDDADVPSAQDLWNQLNELQEKLQTLLSNVE